MLKLFSLHLALLFSVGVYSNQESIIPNDGIDDSQAFKELILNTPQGEELIISKPGVYDICSTIGLSNLNRIKISSNKGVILKKCGILTVNTF